MTTPAIERLRQLLEKDADGTCVRCGDDYELRMGHDPTRFCDICAQETMDTLPSLLALLTAAMHENEALRAYCDNPYMGRCGTSQLKAYKLLEKLPALRVATDRAAAEVERAGTQ